ncbi:RlpA-like double-psi beta-barrel-protein domain-containing protein-containing protein [Mycena maculata]|uniref:RlpA-like double-psi beta-barrel-protein domain-containing protein-containing protein n=1 Tax=Mycena maculata TaxID=230809 RepID=A0AAD7IAD0_9AGAR|nr:RlpA-like double-psi beta-barrel-protein domain-containing protein-containing protein [Mycena maculata]
MIAPQPEQVSSEVEEAIQWRAEVSEFVELRAANPVKRQSFNAEATYYDTDGGFGACGTQLQNSDFAVALSEDTWDGGAHCGESITVDYNGASVIVTVEDLCPGCSGDNIDLVEAAMAALDSNYVNDGIIPVTWFFD